MRIVRQPIERGPWKVDALIDPPHVQIPVDVLVGFAEIGKAIYENAAGVRFKTGPRKGQLRWESTALDATTRFVRVSGRLTGVSAENVTDLVETIHRWSTKAKPKKTKKTGKLPSLPGVPKP